MTRNSCKLILVLLACAAPLTAVLVHAQQQSGTSAAHFVLSGSNAQANASAARNSRPFIGDAEAQAKLDALISKSKHEAATPASPSAETAESLSRGRPSVDALGAEAGPGSSPAAGENPEYVWIGIVAALGLAASLAATGYLAWSRLQPSNNAVAAFMPRALPQPPRKTTPVPAADKDIRPERRAA
jgi:hypothetical protein